MQQTREKESAKDTRNQPCWWLWFGGIVIVRNLITFCISSDVKWEKCIFSSLRPAVHFFFSSALRQLHVAHLRCVFGRLSRVSPCLCPLPPVVCAELLPKCHSALALLSWQCVVDSSQERGAGTVRLNHSIDWCPIQLVYFFIFGCAGHHIWRGGEFFHVPKEHQRCGHGPEFLPYGWSLHRQR